MPYMELFSGLLWGSLLRHSADDWVASSPARARPPELPALQQLGSPLVSRVLSKCLADTIHRFLKWERISRIGRKVRDDASSPRSSVTGDLHPCLGRRQSDEGPESKPV